MGEAKRRRDRGDETHDQAWRDEQRRRAIAEGWVPARHYVEAGGRPTRKRGFLDAVEIIT